jgi:RNA polymerase sigma-70 factor, ECF subfamily
VSVDVDEDRAVIASVLAGDTAAFAVLVRRWQGPLVNMAWRYCRDRGRAEEMAQEAFLRAYRNLAQWRGESAFSTWLFALAANVYRTELRRIPATMLSLDEIAEPPDERLSTTAYDDASRDEALRRAVLALPPKYRDAVLLFYFHEQDVPAAARTLRVPEGTLKARLFRGRELLRSKFSRPKRKPAPAAAAQFQAQQVKEVP